MIVFAELFLIVMVGIAVGILVSPRESDQHQQVRTERSRIDREVQLAERRLHSIASDALGAMLDATGQTQSGYGKTQQ
jgi:hypothetical protein